MFAFVNISFKYCKLTIIIQIMQMNENAGSNRSYIIALFRCRTVSRNSYEVICPTRHGYNKMKCEMSDIESL